MKIKYIIFSLIIIFLTSCIKLEENEECELSNRVNSYLEIIEGSQFNVFDEVNDTAYLSDITYSMIINSKHMNPFSLEWFGKPFYYYQLDAINYSMYLHLDCDDDFSTNLSLDQLASNNVNYSLESEGNYSLIKNIEINDIKYSNVFKVSQPRVDDSMHVYHRFNETEGMFTDTIQTTFPAREAVFCKERGFLYLKDLESGEYILTNFE